MLWIVYAEDKDGGAGQRASGREDHLAYLVKQKATLFFGGGLLDDEGPGRFGSCLIINVPNRAAAEAWMANEPYNVSGLFKKVTVARLRNGHFNPQALPKSAEGE